MEPYCELILPYISMPMAYNYLKLIIYQQRWQEENGQQPHQAADECLHGLVTHEAAPDRTRKSKNAQLWNFKATWIRVEDTDRVRKAAVHWWGKENPGKTHDWSSWLQIQTPKKTQKPEGPWLPLHHALPFSFNGCSKSRLVGFNCNNDLKSSIFIIKCKWGQCHNIYQNDIQVMPLKRGAFRNLSSKELKIRGWHLLEWHEAKCNLSE